MMKVLIVTGGIGSGKSLVCRMLAHSFDIPVYEADRRVKDLYIEVPSILDDIEKSLELCLRDISGAFNPRKLADVIFTDSEALRIVEDIVFPRLKEDFIIWAEKQGKEVVAFESATVLEKSQFDDFGDLVLMIDAPKELRLTRACSRDGVDPASIQARMAAQPLMNYMSDGGCCERIDQTIMNDGTEGDLQRKLTEFIEKYVLTKMLQV